MKCGFSNIVDLSLALHCDMNVFFDTQKIDQKWSQSCSRDQVIFYRQSARRLLKYAPWVATN